jgi:hypothetical protein
MESTVVKLRRSARGKTLSCVNSSGGNGVIVCAFDLSEEGNIAKWEAEIEWRH